MRWLERKIVYSVGFGFFFLLAVGAVLFYLRGAREPPIEVVRIGYGVGAPVRKRFLEEMAIPG